MRVGPNEYRSRVSWNVLLSGEQLLYLIAHTMTLSHHQRHRLSSRWACSVQESLSLFPLSPQTPVQEILSATQGTGQIRHIRIRWQWVRRKAQCDICKNSQLFDVSEHDVYARCSRYQCQRWSISRDSTRPSALSSTGQDGQGSTNLVVGPHGSISLTICAEGGWSDGNPNFCYSRTYNIS